MSDTTIEWADKVWNCLRGCSRVSPGCGGSDGGGCYAERMAHRFSGPDQPYEGLTRMTHGGPRWTGKIQLVPEKLKEPVRWRKPCRIFCNSMSDLFHEDVPDDFLDKVFAGHFSGECAQNFFTFAQRLKVTTSDTVSSEERWLCIRM